MTSSIGVKRSSNMMVDAETSATKTGKTNSAMVDHSILQDCITENLDQLAGASTKVR
jgi:hypothetical protein